MIPRPVIAALATIVTIWLTLVYSAQLQQLDKLTYLPLAMRAFTEPSPTATPLLDSRVTALETQVAALSRLLTPTPTPWYQTVVLPTPKPVLAPGWGEDDLQVSTTISPTDPAKDPYARGFLGYQVPWGRATVYITATLTQAVAGGGRSPVQGASPELLVVDPIGDNANDYSLTELLGNYYLDQTFAGYTLRDHWVAATTGYPLTGSDGRATWTFQVDERHRGHWLYFIVIVKYQDNAWYRQLPVWAR